jgi:hypothetical protein
LLRRHFIDVVPVLLTKQILLKGTCLLWSAYYEIYTLQAS